MREPGLLRRFVNWFCFWRRRKPRGFVQSAMLVRTNSDGSQVFRGANGMDYVVHVDYADSSNRFGQLGSLVKRPDGRLHFVRDEAGYEI